MDKQKIKKSRTMQISYPATKVLAKKGTRLKNKRSPTPLTQSWPQARPRWVPEEHLKYGLFPRKTPRTQMIPIPNELKKQKKFPKKEPHNPVIIVPIPKPMTGGSASPPGLAMSDTLHMDIRPRPTSQRKPYRM